MDPETSERRWYVYVDWTTEPTPRPYYVGSGTYARVVSRERNATHAQIATEFGWDRYVVAGPLGVSEARAEERRLVRALKTYAWGNGRAAFGANLTCDGQGKHHGPPKVHRATGLSGRAVGMFYKRRYMLRKLGLEP